MKRTARAGWEALSLAFLAACSASTNIPAGGGSSVADAADDSAVGTADAPWLTDATPVDYDSGVAAADSGGVMDGGTAPGDASPAVDAQAVRAIMTKVAKFELGPSGELSDAGTAGDNNWIDAVFYIGLVAAYQTTQDTSLLDAAKAWANANNWAIYPAPPNKRADGQACFQAYLDLYLLDPSHPPADIQSAQASFDAMLVEPMLTGRKEWYWCDALFMAPPSLARLGAAAATPAAGAKYFAFLDTMYWDAKDLLFDPNSGLFWRDAVPNPNIMVDPPSIWSRGNGWVMAGLARVLQYLPATDARHGDYEQLLKSLAEKVAPLQRADGLWRTALVHTMAPDPDNPETSGTGLLTFAMAFGVEQGILDRATYLPVVQKAWNGLVSNVDPQGRLEWVQPTGRGPGPALQSDSLPYGAGAFLLAGSEIVKL
jgi:unsaturated rhamnogalacturonyl hydrolase